MQSKNFARIALATGLILLIPLAAMQFTEEVNWDVFDFAFMGALLFGTGLAYELLAANATTIAYRAGVGVALAAAFILVWANAAVGIVGGPHIASFVYVIGVLAVALAGALVARFRPAGMAHALFITAFAQALLAVIVLLAGWGATEPGWPQKILFATGFFVALWLVSAMLFRRASTSQYR